MTIQVLASSVVLAMAAASLTACGGGGSDEQVTVMKPLAIAAPQVQSDGQTVFSLFPAPGASTAEQNALVAAGVLVLSKQCGSQSFAGAATVGGTPTYVVVFQVAASDLAKAVALDYRPMTPAIEATLGTLYDCSTKSI